MTLDLTGFKNGTITGIQATKARSGGSIIWLCKCDCGEVIRLPARELVHSKSLAHPGCKIRIQACHPLYSTWLGIKRRCADKNNKNYGGRGIKVSDEWKKSFQSFLQDMGPKPSAIHSVERKDVNGDYCKENCVWATPQEQALNTRKDKLSPEDCYVIFTSKESAKKIAKEYNVSEKTVANIRCHCYSRSIKSYILYKLALEQAIPNSSLQD